VLKSFDGIISTSIAIQCNVKQSLEADFDDEKTQYNHIIIVRQSMVQTKPSFFPLSVVLKPTK
jgi:hypothetical protein